MQLPEDLLSMIAVFVESVLRVLSHWQLAVEPASELRIYILIII